MSRRLLVNAATVQVGGGLQAAAAFIVNAAQQSSDLTWSYALSGPLARELRGLGVDTRQPGMSVLRSTPARSRAARRDIAALVTRVDPEAVFTFFGPAYVRFPRPHLCGVADGWVTHADALAYGALAGPVARLKMRLLCRYKAYWLRLADAWVVEAEVARAGLSRRIGCPSSVVSVVPNTCAPHYLAADDGHRLLEPTERLRILCFSAYYRNKNLELVPAVAAELRALGRLPSFELILTLPDCAQLGALLVRAERLGVADAIANIGPVALADGPALYRSCDLVFHPSILETFSATYPEAMAMGVPLVVSDRDFARSVCADAAVYFHPLDPRAAATAIVGVLGDPGRRDCLVQAGRRRLAELARPEDKQERLMEVIHSFLQRGHRL